MCACKMTEREGRTGLDTGTEGNWEVGWEAGNLAAVRVVRLGVEGLEHLQRIIMLPDPGPVQCIICDRYVILKAALHIYGEPSYS